MLKRLLRHTWVLIGMIGLVVLGYLLLVLLPAKSAKSIVSDQAQQMSSVSTSALAIKIGLTATLNTSQVKVSDRNSPNDLYNQIKNASDQATILRDKLKTASPGYPFATPFYKLQTDTSNLLKKAYDFYPSVESALTADSDRVSYDSKLVLAVTDFLAFDTHNILGTLDHVKDYETLNGLLDQISRGLIKAEGRLGELSPQPGLDKDRIASAMKNLRQAVDGLSKVASLSSYPGEEVKFEQQFLAAQKDTLTIMGNFWQSQPDRKTHLSTWNDLYLQSVDLNRLLSNLNSQIP